jgi:hypothetical protein
MELGINSWQGRKHQQLKEIINKEPAPDQGHIMRVTQAEEHVDNARSSNMRDFFTAR